MEQSLVYLIKLQRVEQLEQSLNKMQKNHPGRRQLYKLRDIIVQKQAHCDAMVERQRTVETELDRAGKQVEDFSSAARQLEDRIYSGKVKNPKELEKLQEKCEKHKTKVRELEEKALILLEEQEHLMKAAAIQGQELSKMKADFNEERLKIKEEIDKIKKQLENVAKEKRQALANLPSEVLTQYNRVKIRKTAPVAMVEEGQCTGCRMRLSIMLVQEVQTTNTVIFCENCGRILVPYEEEQ